MTILDSSQSLALAQSTELKALYKQLQTNWEFYPDLVQYMRTHQLQAEHYHRVGRWLEKMFTRNLAQDPQLKVCLLGQSNTSTLKYMLMAEALQRGVVIEVVEGKYDQVLQHSMQGVDAHIVVCFPCSVKLQRLFLTQVYQQQNQKDMLQFTTELQEQETLFWKSVWQNLQTQSEQGSYKQSIIQVGYEQMNSMAQNLMTHNSIGGLGHCIRSINQHLRETLAPHHYFLDLSALTKIYGAYSVYSTRNYHWTKDMFSADGSLSIVKALWAGVRTLYTGPKKVLVLDLDHTLWGGVVGEDGALGIHIGQDTQGSAHYDLQLACKALQQQGVLLAVCSKNNLADAQAPFKENPEMLLKLEDFVAFKANWEPKAHNIAHIAQELNLGLDSFVFLDDHPAERALVREMLPMVEVVELSSDPAQYVLDLAKGFWFESLGMTHEDRVRTQQYQAEQARKELQTQVHSIDSYLESLQMKAQVSAITPTDFPRVMQLIAKTNQFNLCTYRHTAEYVTQLCEDDRSIALCLRAQDRFGDYGLVSVILAKAHPIHHHLLYLDTWLMSCRVIARSVELFFFNQLVIQAQALGFQTLHAHYRASPKNNLIADLLTRVQCVAVDTQMARDHTESMWLAQQHHRETATQSQYYTLDLTKFTELTHFIQS